MAVLQNGSAQPRVTLSNDDIEKPEADDRLYRIIKLRNDLEAVLVQDAKADKASAALSVGVGSYKDDDDMPGLAHAVEHMLFMGTEKYPKENEYANYLSAHSGYSNAYTKGTATVYFFAMAATSDVLPSTNADNAPATDAADANGSATQPAATPTNGHSTKEDDHIFYGALDRFAQFFIKPLFLESSLEREMQAVNSENNGNLQSDSWRLSKLTGSLCNPKHPYNRFTTGTLKTLYEEPLAKGIDVRQRFIDFHKKNYSSNRMKLVVLGRESLDQLQDWVVELFSDIENQNLAENRWDDIPLITPDGDSLTVYAKPVKDSRKLAINFTYPDEDELYDTDPSHYISHLIGHEGEGSLLSYLKNNSWVDELSAGGYTICPGSGTFSVNINLTEQGLIHVEDVVKTVFQYISLLNEQPPNESIFNELISTGKLAFRFSQKSEPYDFTSGLADSMQLDFPRNRILSHGWFPRKFDPADINEGLSWLRPDNARVMITSQHTREVWDHKEKWYGTEYSIDKWSSEFRASLDEAVKSTSETRPKELHLHRPNEFIPTRLEVAKREVANPAKNPKLLRNDKHLRLWYKKDDQFWVPKAQFSCILQSTAPSATVENQVIGDIFTQMVCDSLVEYAYEASLASLYYKLYNGYDSLVVEIWGFNDKAAVLLEKVLHTLRNATFKEDRFQSIKESTIRAELNTRFSSLHTQPRQWRTYITTDKVSLSEQRVAALEKVTIADLETFVDKVVEKSYLEMLAVGNLTKEDARGLASIAESYLKPVGLLSERFPSQRVVQLPLGSNYVYQRDVHDPENVNNCLETCYSTGHNKDIRDVAIAQLTADILREPCYDQLRTVEQLGYVVQSGWGSPWPNTNHFIMIRVQGVRPVDYLESRIEAFLTKFRTFIEEIDAGKLEKYKSGLCNSLLEKNKTVYEEADDFIGYIYAGSYFFDKQDFVAAEVRKLTLDDVLAFYDSFLSPKSKTRSRLSIHFISQKKPEAAAQLSDEEKVDKLATALANHLSIASIPVDQAQLKARFANVGLGPGADEAVTASIASYLKEDIQLPEDVVDKFVTEGKPQLAPILVSAGITPAIESSDADGKEIELQERTYITDLEQLKKTLPRIPLQEPCKPLSEFEDVEVKL